MRSERTETLLPEPAGAVSAASEQGVMVTAIRDIYGRQTAMERFGTPVTYRAGARAIPGVSLRSRVEAARADVDDVS